MHGAHASPEHAAEALAAPGGVMVLFAVGMVLTYAGIAHAKLHKTVAALAGAVVLVSVAVAIDLFPYPHVYEILGKDLNVLGVIIGTGILVNVIGKSGLFHFLSIWIVRATGGRTGALYAAVCLLTFVLVTFLTIVPAMLVVSSLVLVICRSLPYDPKPLLLSAAISANSGALVTFASGLPNLMIGTAAELPYVSFLVYSAPYAVISLALAVGALRYFYREDLPWKQDAESRAHLAEKIEEFDPWALVEDRALLVRCALILVATVIGFALAQKLGVGLDHIALAGGTAALLFGGHSVEETIPRVNWTIILFFVGLFLVIGCVEATGALTVVAQGVVSLTGGSLGALTATLVGFSAIASSLVDNIPVAATLIPIVREIGATGLSEAPLWWALILGCNLGGNATPIGSISCVIALHTLEHEEHVHVSWGEFVKVGGTIMVVQVIGAVAYLSALLHLGALG